MVRAIEAAEIIIFCGPAADAFLKEGIMKTKNIENGLALVGALFILVAVAVAANSALNNQLGLDFPQLNQTSTLVANS